MIIGKTSPVADVAASVAEALERFHITAVLSGGACASIYSRGLYQSVDLDFIIQSTTTQAALERAMWDAGFRRSGNQYVHPETPLYVEFPPGPLAIGGDYHVEPIRLKLRRGHIWALSATDSCRDRLAAFLHWDDQQSLKTAVAIALRTDVDLEEIKSWARREGQLAKFQEFLRELEGAKARSERRKARSKKRRE